MSFWILVRRGLFLNQSNSGAARIVQAPNSNAIKIPTRTADAMFRELAIKKIDLIKIDERVLKSRSCKAYTVRSKSPTASDYI
jgi:hypothetical protein